MEAVVKKWGNSLGIRIPNMLVRDFALADGIRVEIRNDGRRIVIDPKPNKLAELLSGVTAQNLHGEISTGRTVGQEIW